MHGFVCLPEPPIGLQELGDKARVCSRKIKEIESAMKFIGPILDNKNHLENQSPQEKLKYWTEEFEKV